MTLDTHGPNGEPRSPAHRAHLETAAREALATIERYSSGEIDGLVACRALVNDEFLREITPIRLLVGFIGVESQFAQDPDDDEPPLDPAELAEQRAERDELLAEEAESLTRDCAALAAHLRQWQDENVTRRAKD